MRQTGNHQSSIKQRHLTPTIPPFTGMSPYISPSNLPLPPMQHESHHLSSNPEDLQQRKQDSSFPGEGGSHQGDLLMSRDSINTTGTGDEQRRSEQRSPGRSTNISQMSGSIVEERPYTTPMTVPGQKYSLSRNTSIASLGGEAPLPP